MQNLNYYNKEKNVNWLTNSDYEMLSFKLKLIRNINSCVSYIMSALYIIAWIEFIRFVVDLYVYFH